MGWFALAAMAALALAVMLAARLPRALLGFAGAAVMLGATGYALQGNPGLAASPATPIRENAAADAALVELRQQMFGRFQYSDSYFYIADALSRAGNNRAAASAMLGGVRSAPNSLPLWTGLGYATASADGAMSPMATMAFRRAHALNPEHPGPWFFEGLALARTGDLPGAKTRWLQALRLSTEGAPYRVGIAERLVLLDRLMAMQAAAQQQPAS